MLITDESVWRPTLRAVAEDGAFALDTETSGLDLWPRSDSPRDFLAGFSIYSPSVGAFYVPVAHSQGTNAEFDWQPGLQFLVDNASRVDLFNLPFDYWMLLHAGVILPRTPMVCQDVYVKSWCVDDVERSHGLKRLSIKRVDPESAYAEGRFKYLLRVQKIRRPSDLNPKDICEYASEDAYLTWRLGRSYDKLLNKMGRQKGIWERDMRALWHYMDMPARGLPVDTKRVNELMAEALKRAEEIEVKMRKQTRIPDFNPGSPSQVALTFGLDTTDDLAMIRSGHKYASDIMEYRGWMKMVSTFYRPMFEGFKLKGYPFRLGGVDDSGRVHPDFVMAGTKSSRTRCSRPPAQGFPRVVKAGLWPWEKELYKAREIIVPPDGMTLVGIDFDQVELRLLAHYCQSPTMVKAFLEKMDLHAITADGIFGNHEGDNRQYGKTLNFSCGMLIGPASLRDLLWRMGRRPSFEEARRVLNGWHRLYPEVRMLGSACDQIAKQKGFVELWTGRRCHLFEHETHKGMSRIVQGGAAELMKEAVLRAIPTINKFGAEALLIIHDELLLLCNTSTVQAIIPQLLTHFEFKATLGPSQPAQFGEPIFRVPITASVKTSTKSWGDMEEWKNPLSVTIS